MDVVRLLLQVGADQDAAMHHSATALHSAAESGRLDVVAI